MGLYVSGFFFSSLESEQTENDGVQRAPKAD